MSSVFYFTYCFSFSKVSSSSFSKSKIEGNGITAQLLLDNGFEIFNEENFKIESNI